MQIVDYICSGQVCERSAEEATDSHEIVVPRAGVFMRHDSWGNTLVDVNHVLFFRRGQPYQMSHPVNGGDVSTIFAVSDDTLLDMLRACDPSVDDRRDAPFTSGHTLIDPRLRLRLIPILRADDPLKAEELALLFLGDVVSSVGVKRVSLVRSQTQHFHRDLAEHIKLLLAEHWHEPLRLRDIADAVHASPYFVCRVFAAHTGLSIHQYLVRLRLLHALERLDENLTTLALDVGFATPSHFSTAFKRIFGLSPAQLRRQRKIPSKIWKD